MDLEVVFGSIETNASLTGRPLAAFCIGAAMSEQSAHHLPFLVVKLDSNAANLPESTDEDLRDSFKQVPFDFDWLFDEDGEDA